MQYTKRCDLHIHTQYSFDSKATMKQYVDAALCKGVDVLCFTDHIECGNFNTFRDFPFAARAEEFHSLKQRYGTQLTLLLGFEVGEPHLHPKEMRFLRSLQPDMIIGSVHYPASYLPERHYTNYEYQRLYDKFVSDMVSDGDFDVLGHMDLPKRYHDDYVEDVETLCKTLQVCLQRGIVPEINTSRYFSRHFTLPSLEIIAKYRDFGGKFVTVNSDSHSAQTLADGFDQVVSNLPQGLRLCYFCGGEIVPLQ